MRKFILLVSVFITTLYNSQLPAQDYNDYPYPATTCTQCISGTCATFDNYSCYKYNCTSFCAWRLERDNNCFQKSCTTATKILFKSGFGNASNWGSKFSSMGYFISDVPTSGAIAFYTSNQTGCSGISSFGHVAYVEEVRPRGGGIYDFTLSQYQGGSCKFESRSTYSISPTSSCKLKFIRFNRFELLNPPSLSVIQGNTLNVSLSVRDNFGGAVNSVQFRCSLYDNDNRFIGEIGTVTKTFSVVGTPQSVSFSKQINSCPGSYKIWIESRLVGASSITPWVLLHTSGNKSSVMGLIVNAVANNNEYTNATSLTVRTSNLYTYGSNCSATRSTSPSFTSTTSCPFVSNAAPDSKDVWFRFTPSLAGNYTIKTLSYSIVDATMAVYTTSNSSGSVLTLLACADGNPFMSSLMPYLSVNIPNTNPVFIRIWGKNRTVGTSVVNTGGFGICVRSGANMKKEDEDSTAILEETELEEVIQEEQQVNDVSVSIENTQPTFESLTIKAYPNPFTTELNFVFELPESATGSLKIYNESGQITREVLSNTELQSGENRHLADISDLPEGFYLGVLEVGGVNKTVRLIKSSRGARGGEQDERFVKEAARFEEMERKLGKSDGK